MNNNHNLLTPWYTVDISLDTVSKCETADRVMTPHIYKNNHATHEMSQGQ